MKVFVAGATGVVGRRLVPLLVCSGHEVTGVARSPAKHEALTRQGARAVNVDLFDRPAVSAAVAGHEAVVNIATHIRETAGWAPAVPSVIEGWLMLVRELARGSAGGVTP